MWRIELPRRLVIGITPFRWGLYFHLRVKLNWWHLKIGFWVQRGLRVSTRRQVQVHKRSPRYVTAIRFNISFWRTKGSVQMPPHVYGFIVYGGRTKP